MITFWMLDPTNRWFRDGLWIGRTFPLPSTLTVPSRSAPVRRPAWESRTPTPGRPLPGKSIRGSPVGGPDPNVPVLPCPVPTSTTVWFGSLLRANRAMLPTFRLVVGPRSVSGTQCGPAGSVVRKLVVFHTPPLAPAAYTVLPDGSDGSTWMLVTCPAFFPEFWDEGPSGVQMFCEVTFDGSWLNRRNPSWIRSATASPSPVPGTPVGSVSVQLFRFPVRLPWLVTRSVQVPWVLLPIRALSGNCGWSA